MRKLLFVVDHIFRYRDDQVFTMGGKFPYRAWESYLDVFNALKVLSRGVPLADEDRLSTSSGEGVAFVFVPGRRGIRRLLDFKRSTRIVESEVASADVLVARLPSELGLKACHLAKKLGKPYLIELVACPWDALWNHGSIFGRLYAPILWARTRLAVAGAPSVRYVTEGFLQRRYPSHGQEFIASNVELDLSYPVLSRDRSSSILTGCVTFGTIGALHTKLKGVHDAVIALSRLKTRRPSISFIYEVVGEGDSSDLRALADSLGLMNEVRFIGTLKAGHEVMDWLDHLDIYLQPSYQEGLPRALIEALSRGCIAVGSTAGGIPELLKPSRLHSPGDVQGLFSIIDQLFGQESKELDSESFDNMQTAKRYDRKILYRRRLESLDSLMKCAMPSNR